MQSILIPHHNVLNKWKDVNGWKTSTSEMRKCVFSWIIFLTKEQKDVISGWVLTCNSAHSWWLYSAAWLGIKAANTMTCYPTQSHCLETEPTNPCPILIRPSARLGSNRYQFKVIGLTRPGLKNAGSGLDTVIFRSPISQKGRLVLYSFGHARLVTKVSTNPSVTQRHQSPVALIPCLYGVEG